MRNPKKNKKKTGNSKVTNVGHNSWVYMVYDGIDGI